MALLQESAVSALAALCNEFYINERGEADPALQGNDSCLSRGTECWAGQNLHFGGMVQNKEGQDWFSNSLKFFRKK